MAYVPFSTDNADYILVYSAHIRDARDDIFNDSKIDSLDAIVLESTDNTPAAIGGSQFGLRFLPPAYGTILRQSHKHGKRIYLADADVSPFGLAASAIALAAPMAVAAAAFSSAKNDIRNAYDNEKPDRRQFLRGLGKGLLGLWLVNGYSGFFLGSFIEGETPNVLESAAASVHRIPPSPLLEARNCAAARKIEDFIVPLLKSYQKKRPKIAVVFGGGHSGMKECLQGKAWRDAVLFAYKQANYLGLDIHNLSRVWEIWPSHSDYRDCEILGQNWFAQAYNCGLF